MVLSVGPCTRSTSSVEWYVQPALGNPDHNLTVTTNIQQPFTTIFVHSPEAMTPKWGEIGWDYQQTWNPRGGHSPFEWVSSYFLRVDRPNRSYLLIMCSELFSEAMQGNLIAAALHWSFLCASRSRKTGVRVDCDSLLPSEKSAIMVYSSPLHQCIRGWMPLTLG